MSTLRPWHSSLFAESGTRPQRDLEGEFQRRFYGLAGQSSAADRPYTMLCHSASTSIDLVAAFLSITGVAIAIPFGVLCGLGTLGEEPVTTG